MDEALVEALTTLTCEHREVVLLRFVSDLSLEQVAEVARRTNAATRTMGVALTAGVVPHAGEPSFTLADDEVEIGIGIHGEPGRERVPLEPVDRIVDRLLRRRHHGRLEGPAALVGATREPSGPGTDAQ